LARAAPLEDLGRAGDITTSAIVPADAAASGDISAVRSTAWATASSSGSTNIVISRQPMLPTKGFETHQAREPTDAGLQGIFRSTATLARLEMVHMVRKRQGRFAFNPAPSLKAITG
jgi:hypothetical protein